MRSDIWKIIAALALSTLLGITTGYVLECLLIGSFAIISWQLYRNDALYRWVLNPKAAPMMESNGLIYLIHREIHRQNIKSSRRKNQMSLLLKQFRRAIGALPDAIVLINRGGKIEWANQNAKPVLGIRWPEDASVRFGDLVRYPEVDKLMSLDELSSAQGVEINSLVNKGSTINVKCVHYTDELRMVVARDVSRLIKVNKMHSDFVANVSHELKTPLTVLRGYLEILEDSGELPDKFIGPVQQMNVESLRMQLIVSDLLYLAKLEDRENKSPHDTIDVTQIVNNIVESVQPLIEDKHHKIELDIDYELSIKGAQTELHSAFANLITNAIHYTADKGQIKIRWRAENNQAVFTVKDNGAGIPAQHLSRLTQRFYRVDADRSREGGGTGLGLAIVKHVLERHNASLEIASEEGEGSEFKCVFPIKQVARAETPSIAN